MQYSNLIYLSHLRHASLAAVLLFLSIIGLVPSAYALDINYAAFSDEDGDIYTIPNNGGLLWHQHTGRLMGSNTWENNAKANVVSDSSAKFGNDIAKVFSGGDGVIYIIKKNGRLFWSRHDGRFSGTTQWAKGPKRASLTLIGSSWSKYTHVFSGGNGVIYTITKDGRMQWFKHNGWLNGENTWAVDSGKQISAGWQGTLKIFSGGHGTIYSIVETGRLRWHLHKGYLTGADDWLYDGIHRPIGENWQTFRQVFSGGDGVIYAITKRGELRWHRHNAWLTGDNNWAPGSGKIINSNLNQLGTIIR